MSIGPAKKNNVMFAQCYYYIPAMSRVKCIFILQLQIY